MTSLFPKFYKDYAKAVDFSTRKSKISLTEKTNPTAGLNCPARIYIHTLKDVGAWIISKVVLHHSHPCCPTQAEMLKQHRKLSMSVRRTIENNKEAGIRPNKTYQSFIAAVGGHCELNFIEKDVRNYITREVRNACMPTIIHRWCIWYITKKIPSKLNGYKGHAEIEQEMSQVVWNSYSKDSFDRNWNDFLLKYDLVGNKWRSERESDVADFYTVILCATKSSIKPQFQHVYTHQKFRKVQAHFRVKANCIKRLTNSALGYSVYEVG
ncbi:hypothetical protein Ahy_A09g045630 [Arachis hypogaea]|uniref:Uncharacterized protein n=1 Tax=Arachis hypogaea TaxID=3818 RepID=A0A445BMS3_ARAHY|nr:hypothetical protein Ahy_A09g045630 [Arachis hypogaea]